MPAATSLLRLLVPTLLLACRPADTLKPEPGDAGDALDASMPALVAALGGEARGTVASPSGPMLPDDAHDRLFLVIRPARGAVQTLELRQSAAP